MSQVSFSQGSQAVRSSSINCGCESPLNSSSALNNLGRQQDNLLGVDSKALKRRAFSNLSQFEGTWRGESVVGSYPVKLKLKQKGNSIVGTSMTTFPGNPQYFNLMSVVGVADKGSLLFRETEVIRQNSPPGWFWCIKQGRLSLSRSNGNTFLNGIWSDPRYPESCSNGQIVTRKDEYENIKVQVKAFIPSNAVPLALLPSTPFLDVYSGDDRSFGMEGTSRASQSITVNVDPERITPLVGEIKRSWGTSKRYDISNGTQIVGKPWWWWELKPGAKPTNVKTLDVDLSNNRIVIRRTKSESKQIDLDFRLDGLNPVALGFLGKIADATISSYITVSIKQQKDSQRPQFKVKGKHDGFPAYELFVNNRLVYTFDPEQASTSPLDLLSNAERKVVIPWQSISW
jgi:hypothetical protein